MASKRAMVIGCKGMDGSHMVDLLESKGYEIYPLAKGEYMQNIKSMDEVYNFSGVSSVISPFYNIHELMEDAQQAVHILQLIKGTKVKFFQASSSLMYGDSNDLIIYGDNCFAPKYPYGVVKLFIHNMINEYRKAGVFAVSGILFPHTSERQKDHFFIKKICKAAINKQKIQLGNLNQVRDYGYAPEYVNIAHEMLQQSEPKDRIIGSGYLFKLRDFVRWAFEHEELDYKDYVTENVDESRDDVSICSFSQSAATYGKDLINTIMNKLKDARTI